LLRGVLRGGCAARWLCCAVAVVPGVLRGELRGVLRLRGVRYSAWCAARCAMQCAAARVWWCCCVR
jgi:hypothetical protein